MYDEVGTRKLMCTPTYFVPKTVWSTKQLRDLNASSCKIRETYRITTLSVLCPFVVFRPLFIILWPRLKRPPEWNYNYQTYMLTRLTCSLCLRVPCRRVPSSYKIRDATITRHASLLVRTTSNLSSPKIDANRSTELYMKWEKTNLNPKIKRSTPLH